jgi:predicted ATPase
LIHKPDCFAVTGGPGAGKTTLMRRLRALGETCVEESARLLIQEAALAGRPRPLDGELGPLMLERDLAAFHAAQGRTFFDRSLVDAWATATLGGRSSPEADEAVNTCRYNRTAFIAPPWAEIYVQDAERIQTWSHAKMVFEMCAAAYEAAGYDLVELPLTPPEARARFVLDAVRDRA